MEKSLQKLKLTNDELDRIGKAFKDPGFCKLFAEYADELNDPENRRRYENEIRMIEMERGVDIEFIKPAPFCVLKSRSWPSLTLEVDLKSRSAKEAPETTEGQKVFINICSSNKLEKPEIIVGGDGIAPTWSIPHSFSLPVEDLDKENKLCLVVDVVFHPEAIERSKGLKCLRKLLHITAVEGVHRQFGYFLGLNREQAKVAWISPHSNEAAILASVRLLKGVTHKGLLRATIVRRKRTDYVQCQEKLAEAENADFAAARSGLNHKEKLAAFSKYKQCLEANLGMVGKASENEIEAKNSSKYKEPRVTLTHSSEFDMLNYTNDCCHDVRSTRPCVIKIDIDLPGIESAACLDLDITEKKLHLQCEKPVAYQLELDLPYPVDPEGGKAMFNKAAHKLLLTLRVIPPPIIKSVRANTEFEPPSDSAVPLIEVLSSTTTQAGEQESVFLDSLATDDDVLNFGKKRRRKKQKKPIESAASTGPTETPTSGVLAPVAETRHVIRMHQLPPSKLVVPKTSSLASIKARQDASSFTLVMAVSNALLESLQLAWSPCEVAQRLMLTCSSYGEGGCTLQWGIVLQCPAPTTYLHEEQLDSCGNDIDNTADAEEPRVICCDVSTDNVAIVLQKPLFLRSWWESIAVGRALGPGLQEEPIVGSAPDLTDLLISPPDTQGLSSTFKLTIHSSDCVQILVNDIPQNPAEVIAVPSNPAILSASAVGSDSGLPRRGILKQRSTSECSTDDGEQTPLRSNLGFFPSPFVCSDEFPSNSEDEAAVPVRASRKYDATTASPDTVFRPLFFARRRGNSVNFSKKDENIAFSPFDPVQTLHNLLRNKAKNARRSERRKRHSSFTASSITLNEMRESSDQDVASLMLKQKRKLRRKISQEGSTKQHPPLGSVKDSAAHLERENGQSNLVSAKSKPSKVKLPENGGSGLWNSIGISANSRSPNPHTTVCPVALTANAIFELDDD